VGSSRVAFLSSSSSSSSSLSSFITRVQLFFLKFCFMLP
jgi:hypothetical protein